jgi:hypothetical protein
MDRHVDWSNESKTHRATSRVQDDNFDAIADDNPFTFSAAEH